MAWQLVRRAVGHYREVVLAVAFLGMAVYESLEIWLLELPRGPGVWLSILIHLVEVVLILGATCIFLRAWQARTAHEVELARLVEKVIFAQEEERRRIAYDLHDGIAQLIVSAKQHVDTCVDLVRHDADRAVHELTKALDRLQRAIVETRRVLMALRPSDVDAIGLVGAVRRSLLETAREAGWSVSFREDLGDVRLPPAVETAGFRILQEALTNAYRHSRSSCVDVELRRDGDWLALEVRDAGVGFPVAAEDSPCRGLGLLSMRERARLLGGTCTIESAENRGTRVRVRLPWRDGHVNGRLA